MKRIPAVLGTICAVSVFFTGCSSLAGDLEVDQEAIESSVAASGEFGEAIAKGTEEDPPDLLEKDLEEKFKDLQGPPAFQIKDGHSKEADDIEQFQVGDLLEDRTFVYGYSTFVEGGREAGGMVHCGALYNYQSGSFTPFHEKTFQRAVAGEAGAKESFILQVCDLGEGEGEIFVYDNGEGYLYQMDGQLKFHADIETFIRRQYPDVADISLVHAVTDGEDRIYMELAVEKELLDIPKGDGKEQKEKGDPQETDKEIEDLDKEMEDKVESLIMVYEFHALHPTAHQENEAFTSQVEAWADMAEGKEFPEGEEPDPDEDWEKVLEKEPDRWSGADLLGPTDTPVYEWKGEPVFKSQEAMCTFVPDENAYQAFMGLEEGRELDRQFIPYEKHFSQLYGRVGQVRYDGAMFYRTVTMYREVEEKDGEGNTVGTRRETWEVDQYYGKDTWHRYAPVENAYIETYWVLDKEKVQWLGNSVGKDILCTGKGGKAYWILPGGGLEEIGALGEQEQVRILCARVNGEEKAALLTSDTQKLMIRPDARHTEGAPVATALIIFKNIREVPAGGDGVYDQAFEQQNQEDLPGGHDGYGGLYITEEHLLPVTLSLDGSLVAALQMKGQAVFEPSGQGYLLTLQDKGLVYYDVLRQDTMTLLEGNWYRSWRLGDEIVSIGFLKDARYGSSDIAFSRVYAYDLDQMAGERMEETLRELMEAEQEEAERASIKAAEDATRESVDPEETVEDMAVQWEREHPEEEREQAASDALKALRETSETPEMDQ